MAKEKLKTNPSVLASKMARLARARIHIDPNAAEVMTEAAAYLRHIAKLKAWQDSNGDLDGFNDLMGEIP